MTVLSRLLHLLRIEDGIANVGAVFILMAVVSGGATFGYAATHQGDLAALRLQETAQDALDGTRHVALVSGPTYVQDANRDGVIGGADSISFDVMVAPGALDVDLATMTAHLTSENSRVNVTPMFDGDSILDRGERTTLTFAPLMDIAPGETFSVELTPADGPTTTVTATMPPAVDGLMTLYY